MEEAVEVGKRAMAIASSLGDIALEVEATRLLGASYIDLAEYRRARDCFVHAIAALSAEGLAARHIPHRIVLHSMRFFLSNCLVPIGEFSDAIANGQASLQEIENVEQPDGPSVTFACLAAGVPRLAKGDFFDAIPLLERALLAARDNFKVLIPVSASWLGLGYVRSGRIPEGLLLLQEAVEQLESTGQVSFYVVSLLFLSEGYLSAGRLDEALLAARRVLDAKRTWKTALEARALYLFGTIASDRDPLDADIAEGYFRNALALAEQLGLRPLAAFCHFERGRLYAKIGRTYEARHEILTAIDLFQAMQMTSWLSRAESALAEMDKVGI